MLRLLLISIPTILIACSSDRPRPVAPAGKAADADFGNLFDIFNPAQSESESESPADTSPDSTDATPGDSENDGQDTSSVVVDQNSPVAIPDKVFRAFLEAALNKQPGETITWGDMASLKRLTIEEADNKESETITSLTGIEAATNLTYLYLLGGSVLYEYADGSSEEEIFGKLTDISPLASLTKLEELQIREHPIENVDVLSQLTNLDVFVVKNPCDELAIFERS